MPALGYVITARELGRVLLDRLPKMGHSMSSPRRGCSDLLIPATGSAWEVERDGLVSTLESRLLVAADGGSSTVREQLDVPVQRWQYGQSAVVTNISPAGAPQCGVRTLHRQRAGRIVAHE